MAEYTLLGIRQWVDKVTYHGAISISRRRAVRVRADVWLDFAPTGLCEVEILTRKVMIIVLASDKA